MSELSVSIKNAVKTFRRFNHPGWRALDALGVRVPSKKYDTFSAISGVSLDIKKGEKIALIGRNGAGKSTLLRVISGQMQLDTGSVTVNGRTQALMELGTGFHPDFTGIDNIRSSLAYQGISGAHVRKVTEEIIEFTELEDFISRPVREYSAGMYARLAFAVATAVTPEILIIDEILGAGDAYFVGKSIQRMRDLTSQGATILFVSHDMSAVQLLCDRGIWIEKGAIRADGDVLKVSKAYLASIREDEEARTRARSMQISKRLAMDNSGRTDLRIYRLVGLGGKLPNSPITVGGIRFGSNDKVSELPLENLDGISRLIMESGVTNWSPVRTVDKITVRDFGNFGGRFPHAPFQIDWSGMPGNDRWLELTVRDPLGQPWVLEYYDHVAASYKPLLEINPSDENNSDWEIHRVTCFEQLQNGQEEGIGQDKNNDISDLQELGADDRYGAGPINITGFGFYDDEGTRRHTLISGTRASSVIAYSSLEVVTDPVAVVAIYRPDGTCAMQVTSNRDGYKIGALRDKGYIRVSFDPLYLGPGDYIASIALFKELNLASKIEPEAYDLHDRCYAIKILPPIGMGVDIGIVNQPSEWRVDA